MSEAMQERFTIDSDQKAEWAIKKIQEARKDRDFWKSYYKDLMDKTEAEYEANVEGLEYMLGEYFKTVPHKKTKTQEAYQLPSGKLILKKQEPEFDRKDELLVPWLKQNAPEFVKVKESSDWAGLKKTVAVFDGNVVNENGEIIPGVTVTSRPEKFVVEVSADE